MLEHVISVVPSHPLMRASPDMRQDTTPIAYPQVTDTEPKDAWNSSILTADFSDAPSFGQNPSWTEGKGGMFTAQRLYIMPFCDGVAGSRFWMRLWGWRLVQADNNHPIPVWIPTLLIQLWCLAGDLRGPQVPPARVGLQLGPRENMCDTLYPMGGWPGQSGRIMSFGPGSGFVAYALIELLGCTKFGFEFQAPDDAPVGMNAFWTRA